ncbi:hypothetical protein BpHYR1_020821 [Brachionus plicatilis]|uniref:Uncharacterized protein n=1 Tax=Brachionus plicatilis TaxID=10195 RepID=A0A3M7PCL5_BRAPC|nr:hypothetical protein BpHYR1_020821 [Brachionus plicatilis]
MISVKFLLNYNNHFLLFIFNSWLLVQRQKTNICGFIFRLNLKRSCLNTATASELAEMAYSEAIYGS